MLGINSPRELISGKFASEIRESLQRVLRGDRGSKKVDTQSQLENSRSAWTAVWM